MAAYAYKGHPYFCSECDWCLENRREETEFGSRIFLWHNGGNCKLTGKMFYMPKIEVTEFVEFGLNGSSRVGIARSGPRA